MFIYFMQIWCYKYIHMSSALKITYHNYEFINYFILCLMNVFLLQDFPEDLSIKDYYPYIFYSYLAEGYQMNLQGAWNNLFVKVHFDHVFNIFSNLFSNFIVLWKGFKEIFLSRSRSQSLCAFVRNYSHLDTYPLRACSFVVFSHSVYDIFLFNKLSVMSIREVKPLPFCVQHICL